MFLQFKSTCLNFLFSPGSCFIISGESKIGYKYIHWPWQVIHCSIVSETSNSFWFHSVIVSTKGPLKGEYCIAEVTIICSSKRFIASSNPVQVNVPEFLKAIKLNQTPSQFFIIVLRVVSILNSFAALSPISSRSSFHLIRSMSITV